MATDLTVTIDPAAIDDFETVHSVVQQLGELGGQLTAWQPPGPYPAKATYRFASSLGVDFFVRDALQIRGVSIDRSDKRVN